MSSFFIRQDNQKKLNSYHPFHLVKKNYRKQTEQTIAANYERGALRIKTAKTTWKG